MLPARLGARRGEDDDAVERLQHERRGEVERRQPKWHGEVERGVTATCLSSCSCSCVRSSSVALGRCGAKGARS